jgi:DNA-directed RNA polymerase specialized sigma24 family protein
VTVAGGQSFEDDYVQLFARAQRIAARILNDWSEAEDVAAETMVRAMSSWSRVRAFSVPWVSRVATNLSIDAIRHRPAVSYRGLPFSLDGDPTDRVMLVWAMRTLSSRQRQAVVLRYLVGLGEGEVAETMGLSAGTVKTHLARGLAALRTRFGDAAQEMCRA